MAPLKRILGAPTAWCIGMGVAIGSGVFRTPGAAAESLGTPFWIIAAWLFGGFFVLMAGLVTAELATRFAEAGGEYVFLREAYGRFVAFFFGWAYTIFVIGGGAATIAAAFGDFGCEWLAIDAVWSGWLAAGAIVAVTVINSMGLRTGAGTQNVLTAVKIAALLVVIVIGCTYGLQSVDWTPTFTADASPNGGRHWLALFATGFLPVLWAYDGTTDAVKMAEEIKDVRRALPRALIGSALALTVLYVAFNLALLRMVPVNAMAGQPFVPGDALAAAIGPAGRNAMLLVAMVVCLGSLGSTVLATIRVTFALARDGLTFRVFARMSRDQAPIPALILAAAVAVVLVLNRSFRQVLDIYFFASAILFGLSYASLIVFRRREREFPSTAFRCPAGPLLAVVLIVIQMGLAVNIIHDNPSDALYTCLLLVGIGLLYLVWRRRGTDTPSHSGGAD
ncbi:MAG: amino acid permease [Phycisphaerales bacterium]|nr:amino acid permease [Phycisphaerales bacterium]